MALTDNNQSGPRALPAAIRAASLEVQGPAARIARLFELHTEMSEIAASARFVSSGLKVGVALALAGFLALIGGGAAFQEESAWLLLVLIGAAAMLRIAIRATVSNLDRA